MGELQPVQPVRAWWGTCERTAILQLAGPFRHVGARALRTFVDEVFGKQDCDTVLIDLRAVNHIDSTGLGLLARIGRCALEARHRRAVIVCPHNDVATTLRSAAFDTLFVMTDVFPFDEPPVLTEVPLKPDAPQNADPNCGRVILEAHQDLASLSEENRRAYAELIASLEAELRRSQRH
jgi:anti-anti-sigma factor